MLYISFEVNLLPAGNHFANEIVSLAGLIELAHHEILVLTGDNDYHSDAKVEGAEKIILWNTPDQLEQIKDGQYGPAAVLKYNIHIGWEYSWNVLDEPSTCNMRQALDDSRPIDQRLKSRQIVAMRLEQLFANSASKLREIGVDAGAGDFQKQLSRKTVAVCM
jgi:hypothetical protein